MAQNFIQFLDPTTAPDYATMWYINDQLPEGFTNVNTKWQTWGIQPDGTIQIIYQIDFDGKVHVSRRYDPNQIPTILHILGAINSFYQSPMTTEDAQLLFNNSKENTKGWMKTRSFLQGKSTAPTYNQITGRDIFVSGLSYDEAARGIYHVMGDNPIYTTYPNRPTPGFTLAP